MYRLVTSGDEMESTREITVNEIQNDCSIKAMLNVINIISCDELYRLIKAQLEMQPAESIECIQCSIRAA